MLFKVQLFSKMDLRNVASWSSLFTVLQQFLTKFAQLPPRQRFPLGFSHLPATQLKMGHTSRDGSLSGSSIITGNKDPVNMPIAYSQHPALQERPFWLRQKIAESYTSAYSVNSRLQLRAAGCMGLHGDHCCAQKTCTVQNDPHLLAGILKKSLTRASCNKWACVEGKHQNIVIDYLVQKKEENYHRWWWQMRQPRILGKIWSIFDYWYGCFYGVVGSTFSKPFQ